MDIPRGLDEYDQLYKPTHELTEEEFELCYQYRCASERIKFNASTEADQKFIETNQARYEELQTRKMNRMMRNIEKLIGETEEEKAISAIRKKKEQARERYKTQIEKDFQEMNDVS